MLDENCKLENAGEVAWDMFHATIGGPTLPRHNILSICGLQARNCRAGD